MEYMQNVGATRYEKVPGSTNLQLSTLGEIAQEYWCDIPNQFPNVTQTVFIIMPNHVHGIIVILPDVQEREPQLNRAGDRRTRCAPTKKYSIRTWQHQDAPVERLYE